MRIVFKALCKLFSDNDRTSVYTMQDSKGKPLYIGRSKNPERRFKQHAKAKDWYPSVDKIKTNSYRTVGKAAKAEKKAIKKQSPTYNVVHNKKGSRNI